MADEAKISKALSKTYDVNMLFPVLGLHVETVFLLPYFTNTEKSKFNFKEILSGANDIKQNEVNTSVLLIMSMAKRDIRITMCLDGKKKISKLLLDKCSSVIPVYKCRFSVIAISILIKSEAVLGQTSQ